jgi:hypothetical protein
MNTLSNDEKILVDEIITKKKRLISVFDSDEMDPFKKSLILGAVQLKNNVNFLNGSIRVTDYNELFSENEKKRISDFEPSVLKIGVPKSPIFGHDTVRVDMLGGLQDKQAYSEFRFNPLYHDITDNNIGYAENTSLRLFSSNIRYYFDESKWGYTLDVIHVANYPAVNSLMTQPSMEIIPTLKYDYDFNANRYVYGAYLHSAFGMNYKLSNWATFINMIKLNGNLATEYDDLYYIGSGVKSMVVVSESSIGKTLFELNYDIGFASGVFSEFNLAVNQYIYATRNVRLFAGVSNDVREGEDSLNLLAGISLYY